MKYFALLFLFLISSFSVHGKSIRERLNNAGGKVVDAAKQPTMRYSIFINMNELNQFDAIKSTKDQQLAILLAISEVYGTPSPSDLNPKLEIPDNSAVSLLSAAIASKLKESPDDFIISGALKRYTDMNARMEGYSSYLKELAIKGGQPLTIAERQRVKAELGYLETRIKLDRDHQEAAGNAEILSQKKRKAALREQKYKDQALDAFLN